MIKKRKKHSEKPKRSIFGFHRKSIRELGEAQMLILEVTAHPLADPWHEQALKQARKLVIGVIGFTVLLIGIGMVVLPGPAVLVIPFGLIILATEFVWAKRLLKRVRAEIHKQTKKRREQKAQEHQAKH